MQRRRAAFVGLLAGSLFSNSLSYVAARSDPSGSGPAEQKPTAGPSGVTRAAEPDAGATPVVEQLLGHAAALELSDGQVAALQIIRDRRTRTLQALTERLRAVEGQSTAAAAHDATTLMQDIGRLQVLSGREALLQLTPTQRRRWVELQAQRRR